MARRKTATDEELALNYLAGFFDQSATGHRSHKYYDTNTDQEKEAREALLRLLRGPGELSNILRWRLAALLDPDQQWEERKLTFENRKRGPQPHHAWAIEVAWHVAIQVGAGIKLDSALVDALARFGSSLSTIERAWREHKDSELLRPIWAQEGTLN